MNVNTEIKAESSFNQKVIVSFKIHFAKLSEFNPALC